SRVHRHAGCLCRPGRTRALPDRWPGNARIDPGGRRRHHRRPARHRHRSHARLAAKAHCLRRAGTLTCKTQTWPRRSTMRRIVHSLLIIIACLSLLAGCGDNAESTSAAAAENADPIVIGSTNFPEQLILANIYADVLEARGFTVEKRLNLGSREIVFPALEAGEIDVMPEYTGALLAYLTDEEGGEHEQQDVADAVQENLPAGLVMLDISPAEDKDALVVTAETAEKHDLNSISDLQGVV